MNTLEVFRRRKDEFYKHDGHSPLTPDQQDDFEGLKYFGENDDLRFELEVEKFGEMEVVPLQTSTGDVQEYVRYGRLTFEVNGEEAQLTLYDSPGGGGYFLPFRDATSGKESYGAGRYLEVEPLADGRIGVDFNMAYNPYCAYNERWRCPFPPVENHLKVPIEAGEQKFKDE